MVSALLTLSALSLAACTVRLVTPYDQVIDNGLVSFNKAFLQFMAEVKNRIPGADGSYAKSVSFYNTQQAGIGTLIQRAHARDPDGSCSGSEVTEQAVQNINSIVIPKLPQQTSGSQRTAAGSSGESGSCISILLINIQDQLTDTACFHQAIYGQTSATCEARGFDVSVAKSLEQAPVSTKLTLLGQVQDAVTTSVTAAMTLELAKQQGAD